MQVLSFWFFSAVAVGAALLFVTRRSAIASAMWLVLTMFSLAALFVILDAHFVAAIQVLVYAGAIMVLFLFVIMLLNLGQRSERDLPRWLGYVVVAAVAALLGSQLWAVSRVAPPEQIRLPAGTVAAMAEQQGAVSVISGPLFRDYLIPFEITSVLLLAAIVGAVVLAKRRL